MRLIVAGDGPQSSELQDLAPSLRADRMSSLWDRWVQRDAIP